MAKLNMISLAPYCTNEGGHYIPYHSALQKLAPVVFQGVLTYLPIEHQLVTLPSTWRGFFQTPKNRWTKYVVRLRDYCRMYSQEQKATLFFVESFSSLDFLALLTATFGCAKKNQRLCVVYRDLIDSHPWKRELQLMIARGLRKILKGRYVSLTDSEIIAAAMQKKQLDVVVIPIPHTEVAGKGDLPLKPMTLWLPGTPVASKGVAIIKELVRKSTDSQVKLLISEIAEMPQGRWQVEKVPQGMLRADYIEILNQTDVVLFPYDAHLYASRTSGPFVEAIVAGKWVITTPGTWMAHELAKFHLEMLIVDWNHSCLLENLREVMQDINVQEKLHAMRAYYQQFHTQNTFEKVLKEVVSNWGH